MNPVIEALQELWAARAKMDFQEYPASRFEQVLRQRNVFKWVENPPFNEPAFGILIETFVFFENASKFSIEYVHWIVLNSLKKDSR